MISIKNKEEIKLLREGGQLLARIMEEIKKKVEPDVTTEELNKFAESLIFQYGKPSFKNYKNYPATLCTSLNEEIVHGLPSKRKLKNGDILSLDLGLNYKGFHTDMAVTLAVGNVDSEGLRLIRAVKKSLKRGIKKIHPGKSFGDLGNTIQRHIESQGFKIIKNLCGHGIGKELHEEPEVLNYGKRGKGIIILEGMVFCIEPMASIGSEEAIQDHDSFTFKTSDGSLSAHFEHTVVVTKNGCEVLTEL